MPSVTNINLQKTLFPMGPSVLDEQGYLSMEVIEQLRQIEKDLKAKNERITEVTDISQDAWNSWLIKRRRPSGASLAFLRVLVSQPEIVLNTLLSDKATNVTEMMA